MPHLMRAPCIPHTSLIVVGRVERHVPIRFTNAAESFLVHLVARKRAHHSNSSVLQLPSAAAVHSPKQLVVAVTVCSTPARSCCILPSSYCLQHPLLVLITHSTLYNCWPVFLPGNCSCYLWRVQLCSNNPRAPNEIRIISILSSIFEHTAKLGALPILSNKKE